MSKVYLIEYTCYDDTNNVLKSGKMRVKNQENKFVAQCNLEDYLRKKHNTFAKLVISSCREDERMYAGDFMSMFNDIVGGKYGK